MKLAIESLEYDLRSADHYIKDRWEAVVRNQEWAADSQKKLTKALEEYVEATQRKDDIRDALVVLRNHEEGT